VALQQPFATSAQQVRSPGAQLRVAQQWCQKRLPLGNRALDKHVRTGPGKTRATRVTSTAEHPGTWMGTFSNSTRMKSSPETDHSSKIIREAYGGQVKPGTVPAELHKRPAIATSPAYRPARQAPGSAAYRRDPNQSPGRETCKRVASSRRTLQSSILW
jgi:hypothetical protein